MKFLIICLGCFFAQIVTAQLTGVNFQLKYNENQCTYDAYLIVNSGSASGNILTIQGSVQYTIVTPHDVTVSVDNSFNPLNGNLPLGSGTVPSNWSLANTALAPAAAPDNDFFGIISNLSPLARYNELTPGTEVKLFSINVNPMPHDINGIRLFENGSDPGPGAAGMGGGNFANIFSIGGSLNQIYEDNSPTIRPEEFAHINGQLVAAVGEEVELSPIGTGTWTSSNTSVAQIDGDMAMAMDEGQTRIILTPDDGGCLEMVELAVDQSEQRNVGIGTFTPHPSAILDLVSTEQGLVLPRMSQLERQSIVSPEEGLVVQQNTGMKGLYFYNGSNWEIVSDMAVASLTGGGNDTEFMYNKLEDLQSLLEEQKAEIESLRKNLLE